METYHLDGLACQCAREYRQGRQRHCTLRLVDNLGVDLRDTNQVLPTTVMRQFQITTTYELCLIDGVDPLYFADVCHGFFNGRALLLVIVTSA